MHSVLLRLQVLLQCRGAARDHTRTVVGACVAWEVCFVLRSQNHVSKAFVKERGASLRNAAVPGTTSAVSTSR